MSLAVIHSRGSYGMYAPCVTVETHLSNGLPSFSIVGLPETAVKESKDRVRSALLNAHFVFPTRRITVNLAPADLPKEGGRFDLPIALGILAASGQIPLDVIMQYEFAGELALTGELRPIHGALSFALAARSSGRSIIVPEENIEEASLVKNLTAYPAKHLLDVAAHLLGNPLLPAAPAPSLVEHAAHPDLCDVRGQLHAKRALEIAAAGAHSLILFGPPGTGKTMLASRLPGILPSMSEEEAIEVATVTSLTGKKIHLHNWRKRPFRAPHHSASHIALVGGGRPPRPGEISLAHRGVLFLDELPEFGRHALEALREPIESGSILISRANRQAEFPAHFQLIAAMNPCPCGHLGNPQQNCRCTSEQVQRYRQKLSGPFLDRIDMHVEVPALSSEFLLQKNELMESSKTIQKRVENARNKQLQRAEKPNALLSLKEIDEFCVLTSTSKNFLEKAAQKFCLSARSVHRVLKLARTIADLAESDAIAMQHVTEAVQYRTLDKKISQV